MFRQDKTVRGFSLNCLANRLTPTCLMYSGSRISCKSYTPRGRLQVVLYTTSWRTGNKPLPTLFA